MTAPAPTHESTTSLGSSPSNARRWAVLSLLLLGIVGASIVGPGFVLADGNEDPPATAGLRQPSRVELNDKFGQIKVDQDASGQWSVTVRTDVGRRKLSPEEFVKLIDAAQVDQRAHGWLFVLLNITTWQGVLWVSIGFLGQALFTFRMVLQWLVSEKQGKSVVPVAFWWGSLIGGVMLLTYFCWRRDIVGIVGQSTGAFVYARNLMLIYSRGGVQSEAVPSTGAHKEANPKASPPGRCQIMR